MNLDDFKSQWQQVEPGSRIDELAAGIRAQANQFESTIFRRDVREIAASVIVMVFFAPMAWFGTNLIVRAGALVIVLAAAGIVIVLHAARKMDRVARPDLPLSEFLQCELRRIDRQVWLLENILLWYLGPMLAGLLLMMVGMPIPVPVQGVMSGIFLAVFGGIYWLNRSAAAKHLAPLRESVQALLTELERKPDERVG